MGTKQLRIQSGDRKTENSCCVMEVKSELKKFSWDQLLHRNVNTDRSRMQGETARHFIETICGASTP
jgi:hypothetical protein